MKQEQVVPLNVHFRNVFTCVKKQEKYKKPNLKKAFATLIGAPSMVPVYDVMRMLSIMSTKMQNYTKIHKKPKKTTKGHKVLQKPKRNTENRKMSQRGAYWLFRDIIIFLNIS